MSMAEEIRILLPKTVAERLKRKAEERRTTVQDLILMALVKVLEEV